MGKIFLIIDKDILFQVISLFIALATFITARAIEKKRDRRIANRDTHQKLELASMDLFRFEGENINLIKPVWEKEAVMPAHGTAAFKATSNYVCQMLNLFELAVKFREDKILPPDVFGSWVAWFHDLVTAPGFPVFWEDQKWDYLPQLRNIMNAGLHLIEEEPDEEVIESRFYEYVSHVFKCDVVAGWTDASEDTPFDDFWRRNNPKHNRNKGKELDMTQLSIRWVTDDSEVQAMVKLFVENSKKNYISHGEIQVGRAINEKEWTQDIAIRMATEFNDALKKSPFGPSRLIGAYFDGKPVGLALVEYDENPNGWYATLSDIAVDKTYRNLNIGEQIVHWIFNHLKENNIPQLFAESNLHNEPAHQFLNKLGFKTLSKVFKKNI